MSIFGDFWDESDDTKRESTKEEAKLGLRKEELDISKGRVQKGEVELGKEIIQEQKTMDIPITREEVVIERRSLNNQASDSPISEEQTIRIPVSEETVDVNKRTVLTGEVSARKREIEDTRHIDETLRREEARINKIGDANIIEEQE